VGGVKKAVPGEVKIFRLVRHGTWNGIGVEKGVCSTLGEH
jgi:hypothetical protein